MRSAEDPEYLAVLDELGALPDELQGRALALFSAGYDAGMRASHVIWRENVLEQSRCLASERQLLGRSNPSWFVVIVLGVLLAIALAAPVVFYFMAR